MQNAYIIAKTEDFKPLSKSIINLGFHEPILLCLNGDLGAGKTTFVKYLGKELGIKQEINSPSFIIHNEYIASNIQLHHLDLYRLEEPFELNELHINRHFKPNTIIAIEWAEKFEEELKELVKEHGQSGIKVLILNFSHTDENTRKVTCTYFQ
jgi:tRNA threonylcarbamoyladenosine biosynthesis protein TsaE